MVALARIAQASLAAQRRRESLMIERGIGYWITPDEQCVPTPPRVSHADLMRQLVEPDALGEAEHEAFTRDANAFALSQGWSRVRIYPSEQIVYIDSAPHARSSTAKPSSTC